MRNSAACLLRSRSAAILLLSAGASSAELRDWENPELTGLNNEKPHASMVICPDVATAQKIDFVHNSQRVKSSF